MTTLDFTLYRKKTPSFPAIVLTPENAEAIIAWGQFQNIIHVDPAGRGILYRIPAYQTRGGPALFGGEADKFAAHGFSREGNHILITWGAYVMKDADESPFNVLTAYKPEDFEKVFEKAEP